MTDKELIRQEIEKRIKEGSSKNDISEGALALNSLLDFIDSLPEQPAREDLEEAAQKYSFNIPTQLEADSVWKQETEQHFKDGAKWQKQQMLKDVVEGQVFQAHDIDKAYKGFVYVISNQFKDLTLLPPNKVKIIIVKEEQQ
jgi:hypothetical protein